MAAKPPRRKPAPLRPVAGGALALAWLAAAATIVCLRIGTGRYCGESPVVRWRLAIYTGECDDEAGCHFARLDGTGPAEYFGFRPIRCRRE